MAGALQLHRQSDARQLRRGVARRHTPIHPTGATIMRYDENGLSAGVAYTRPIATSTSRYADSRVVSMGFPFETIRGAKARNRLMADIMHFLLPHR